jgi:hypothetical protein
MQSRVDFWVKVKSQVSDGRSITQGNTESHQRKEAVHKSPEAFWRLVQPPMIFKADDRARVQQSAE